MTDYSEVPIPEGKETEEYTYIERRAEILRAIEQKGHPWGFNYSQLGRRYGVSRQQIAKDFDRLKEWYEDRIGEEAEFSSDLAYRKIVKEHLDNNDLEKARRALDSWNSWLQDTGKQEKEPEKLEHTGEGGNPFNVVIERTKHGDE